jgi:hypothetical protein
VRHPHFLGGSYSQPGNRTASEHQLCGKY